MRSIRCAPRRYLSRGQQGSLCEKQDLCVLWHHVECYQAAQHMYQKALSLHMGMVLSVWEAPSTEVL